MVLDIAWLSVAPQVGISGTQFPIYFIHYSYSYSHYNTVWIAKILAGTPEIVL